MLFSQPAVIEEVDGKERNKDNLDTHVVEMDDKISVSSYSTSTDDLGGQHATDLTKASKVFERTIHKDCDLRNSGGGNIKISKFRQKSPLLLRRDEEESLSENQKKNINKDDRGSGQSNDNSAIFLGHDHHNLLTRSRSIQTCITINDQVKTTPQTQALKPGEVSIPLNETVVDRWITHENENSSSSDQFEQKVINVYDDSDHEIKVKGYQAIDKRNSVSRNAVVVLKDILDSVGHTSPEILTQSGTQFSEMMSINERIPFKALTLERTYTLPVDVVERATEYNKKVNAEERDVIELDVERMNEVTNKVDGEIGRENKAKDLSLFQDEEESKEILYVDWNEQDDWAPFTEEAEINVSCTEQKTEESFFSHDIRGEGVMISNQSVEMIDCLLKNYQTKFSMPNRKDDKILLGVDCYQRKGEMEKNTRPEKSPKEFSRNGKKTSKNLKKVVENSIKVSRIPKNSEIKTSETFGGNAVITPMMTLKPSPMKITGTSGSIAEREITLSRVFEKFPSEIFLESVQDTIVNESNLEIAQISPNKQSRCTKYSGVNFTENWGHFFNKKTESGIEVDFQSSESSGKKSLESLNHKFGEKSVIESEMDPSNTVSKSTKSIDEENADVKFVVSKIGNLKFPTEQRIQNYSLMGSWNFGEKNVSIEKIEALDPIEAFRFSENQVPKRNEESDASLSERKFEVLKLKEELEPPKSKDGAEALASNEEPEASTSKDPKTSKFIENLEGLKSKDGIDLPKSERNTDVIKSKKEFDYLKFQKILETLESKGKSYLPESEKESETLKSQETLFSKQKDELMKPKNIYYEARMPSAPPKEFPIVTEFPDGRKEEPDFLELFKDNTAKECYAELENLEMNSANKLIFLVRKNTESTGNTKKTFNNSHISILDGDEKADKIKRNKRIETIQTRDKELSVELLNLTKNNRNFKEYSVEYFPRKKFQPEEKLKKSSVKRIVASPLKKQCSENQKSLESKELSLVEANGRKHGPVITKIEVLQTGILFHDSIEKLKANLEEKAQKGKTAKTETSEQEIELERKILSNQSLLKFKTDFDSLPVKCKTDLNQLRLRSKLDSNQLSVKSKSGLNRTPQESRFDKENIQHKVCQKDALPAFLLNYSSSEKDDDSESIDTDVAMENDSSGRSFSHIKKDPEDECKTVKTKYDSNLENQGSSKNSVAKDSSVDSVLCDSDSHMAVEKGNSALTKIMYALEEIVSALKEEGAADESSRNENKNKKRKIKEITRNVKIEILEQKKEKIEKFNMDIKKINEETKELKGLERSKEKDAKITETIFLSEAKKEKEFTSKSKIPQFNVEESRLQEKCDEKNKVKEGVSAFEKKGRLKKNYFNVGTKDQVSGEIPEFDLKTPPREDLMKNAKKKGKRGKIGKSGIFQVSSKPDKKQSNYVQKRKINKVERKIKGQEKNIHDYADKIKYKERKVRKNKIKGAFDFKVQEKNADTAGTNTKIRKIQGRNIESFPNLLKKNLYIPYPLAFDENREVLPNAHTKRIQMCVPSLSMFDVKQEKVSNIVVENSELQISLSGSTSEFESKPVLKIKKVNECLRELILQRKRKPLSHFLFHKGEKNLKHPKKWNN